MKRPLATIGTAVLCLLAVVFVFKKTAAYALLLVFTLFAIMLLLRKVNKTTWVILSVCIATVCFALMTIDNSEKTVKRYAGMDYDIVAIVTDVEVRNDRVFAYADVTSVNGKSERAATVRFYAYNRIKAGDEISARFVFSDKIVNTDSLKPQFYGELIELYSIEREKDKLILFTSELKENALKSITAVLSGDEGLLAGAVLTGNKEIVPANIRLSFERSGISHILVISGLHVTVILSAIYFSLKKLKVNRFVILFVICLVSGAFLVFYGFSPSIARAVVMAVVVYGGKTSFRRSDGVTSLVIAGLVIAAVDPRAVIDASFLLSFGCCFAIVTVYPLIYSKISEKVEKIKSDIVIDLIKASLLTVTITVTITPVCILFSLSTSVLSPITNLLVVWTVPFLLVLSALLAISFSLFSYGLVTNLLGLVVGLFAKLIIVISRFISSFAFSAVSTHDLYLKLWLLFAAIIFAVCYIYKSKRVGIRFVAFCLSVMLLAGVLSKIISTQNKPTILLYNGTSAIISDEHETAIILNDTDVDGIDYLVSFLNYRFIDNIKYVIINYDASDAVEKKICETFISSEILSRYPIYPCFEGETTICERMTREVGDVGILVNEEGIVKAYYGFNVVEFCSKVTDDSLDDGEDCEITVFWRDAKIDPDKPLNYVIRYDEVSYSGEKETRYTYFDNVTIYFNDYLDFKVVRE